MRTESGQKLLYTMGIVAILAITSTTLGLLGIQGNANTGHSLVKKNKNILFILAESSQYPNDGPQGRQTEASNISSLIADGASFNRAFIASSLCGSSQQSVLTGRYISNGWLADGSNSKNDTVYFPLLLEQSGYETAFFEGAGAQASGQPLLGDWRQVVSKPGPCSAVALKGEDEAGGNDLNEGRWSGLADDIVHWLDGRDVDKPFFIYVASQENLADNIVGRLRQWLAANGQAEHTAIVYMGEGRGPCCGLSSVVAAAEPPVVGLKLHDSISYDEFIHVPLFIYMPDISDSKQVIDAMVSSIDIAPTLLDIAGIVAPDILDGESLLPLLAGIRPHYWRDKLMYEYYNGPASGVGATGLRTETYKYIQHHGVPGGQELYDLTFTQAERHNLIDRPEYLEIKTQLHSQLSRMLDKNKMLMSRGSTPVAPVIVDP